MEREASFDKMVLPRSNRSVTYVLSVPLTSGVEIVWLGLTDLVREGRWVWNSNRQEATYFNWRHGAPDDSHYFENGQDCAMILSDGTWDDHWCENLGDSWRPSPVCEME